MRESRSPTGPASGSFEKRKSSEPDDRRDDVDRPSPRTFMDRRVDDAGGQRPGAGGTGGKGQMGPRAATGWLYRLGVSALPFAENGPEADALDQRAFRGAICL